MSLKSKGHHRSGAHIKSADASSSVAAVFESRPDETLLSAELLSTLYSPDCSDKEAEDRAHRILLPLVKAQVSLFKENPHLETIREFRIACAVCPQQTLFRGWSALHIHAQKYWKCFPNQHQGYSKALSEVLQAEKVGSLAAAATTDGLAWPPVLLVDNGAGKTTFDGALRRSKGLQGMDVPCTLNDMELEEVLAVYKKRKGDDRDVVVYPASEIGLLDADKLTDALDQNPHLAGCLKVRVSKDEAQLKSSLKEHLYADDDGHETYRREKENDDKASGAVHSEFDYEKHRPMGTWATLKEIRDSGRVGLILGKWAKGFAKGKEHSLAYKWPFQKSRKLREMDEKFQESLRRHHAAGAAGSEKLKLQLDEIEKQLRKERLLWLKEISGVREQFEDVEKDIANDEAHKDLDRRIVQMNLEKEMKEESDEELEELFSHRLKQGLALHRKRQQNIEESERNREMMLRGWRYEENNFRKQAELAKEERDCITRSLEHEEMLDSISRILEGCGCCHHEGGCNVEECGCHPWK
ncbi:hypothetical protein GOP47_0020988 [Adiantum capillus-veneris]|uniref:Uncharacterized protein n=1 Tax=Adiantum capillus-veneris TaxID=13818 RepID=A0A9D4UA86_ADICA|nr:hypothetical protein GOP47_0020988 [Adiantum capillus-veneris]